MAMSLVLAQTLAVLAACACVVVVDATTGTNYPSATLAALAKAWPTDLPRAVDYRQCVTKVKKQVGGSCHQYAQDLTMEAQLCLARGGKKAMLDINDFWSCKNYGNWVKTTTNPSSPGPDIEWWRALHGTYEITTDDEFEAAEAAAQNCSAVWGGHNGVNATTLENKGMSVDQCGCKRSKAAAPAWPNDIGYTGFGTRTASSRILLPAKDASNLAASRWPHTVPRWGGTQLITEGTCAQASSCSQLSLADCMAASKSMELGEVGSAINSSPHGCYKYGSKLFFNNGSAPATNCTATRSCVCTCTQVDTDVMLGSKNSRTCVQTPRTDNVDGWMNELWLAGLIAKFGPSWVETFVMGFGYGTPQNPQAECLLKTYHKDGHNYPILGYNATDLKNAYWILGSTPTGYSSDKTSTKNESDWGFAFKKMFTYCKSSDHLPGSYGLAGHLRISTMCPSDTDVRSASWGGGLACDAEDKCMNDSHHHSAA